MDAETREYLRREVDRRRREETRLAQVVKQQKARRRNRDRRPPANPHKHPMCLVRSAPIFDGLIKHATRYGWGETPNQVFEEIAARTGYTARSIKRFAEQERISFDVADYIVSRVNVHLWTDDERMNEVYEAVDFRWWDPEFVAEQRRERVRAYHKTYAKTRKVKAEERLSKRQQALRESEDLDQATTDLEVLRERIEADLAAAPARVG